MPKPPRRPFHRPAAKKSAPPRDKGWDPVAAWYDKLVGDEGSDYHKHVILPATLRMLDVKEGESHIDVCCGQGVLTRPLLDCGLGKFTGVDASPRLIDAAKSRHGSNPRAKFICADACAPAAKWADGTYDVGSCLMAVHDVPDPVALFRNLALALKPGSRAVLVFMHPCFRVPRQSHWGWDENHKIQYRRLDRYGSPLDIQITTHPGQQTGEGTIFYHRPLADLLNALGDAGLAVTHSEELYSHRRSQAGGSRSRAEHRAAAEFPMFLALKVMRVG